MIKCARPPEKPRKEIYEHRQEWLTMRALLYLLFLVCLVPLFFCAQLVPWSLVCRIWVKNPIAPRTFRSNVMIMMMKREARLRLGGLIVVALRGEKNHE